MYIETSGEYTNACVSDAIIEQNPPLDEETEDFESTEELPENPEKNVYMTETGECYYREDCYFLKSKINVTSSKIKILGLLPCSKCNPPELANYFD